MTPRWGVRWTETEVCRLEMWWGTRSVKEIARQLDRTPTAVINKAQKLGLRQRDDRGWLSLSEAARESGYGRNTLRLAAKKLGLQFQREPARGTRRRGLRLRVTREQLATLLETLDPVAGARGLDVRRNPGRWGSPGFPKACIECGTTEEPHQAKGRCATCYSRFAQRFYRRGREAKAQVKGRAEGLRIAAQLVERWRAGKGPLGITVATNKVLLELSTELTRRMLDDDPTYFDEET